jgi:hypothetical protein
MVSSGLRCQWYIRLVTRFDGETSYLPLVISHRSVIEGPTHELLVSELLKKLLTATLFTFNLTKAYHAVPP